MNAGELLFLPAFWWHHVQAADVAVSVNFWWSPQLRQVLESPNATRALPNFYRMDRLAEFKRTFLLPAQLNFLTAAELFLNNGKTWAACVLTLAAFDEWARDHDDFYRVDRPSGCRLSALSDDLRPICAAIAADERMLPQHRHVIESVPSLASQVAQFLSDTRTEREKVAALLEIMVALRRKDDGI
jgi:jumonji domain-containing protein 7